jgi:threonylcarbamoyladenosine tRNA methylthiotransferase MtaB
MILTGCAATADPSGLLRERPDALVIPNAEKSRLPDITAGFLAPSPHGTGSGTSPVPLRSRPFLKIQDGCDNSCSYCIVRIARGPSISIPKDRVLEQVRKLADVGIGEIVLTGVNTASYRSGTVGLPELLDSLQSLRLPVRFRLSSLEPASLYPSRLDSFGGPCICDHFHLSIQSGSPEILKNMNRSPDVGRIHGLIDGLRRLHPNAAIGADFIVGFPGETESRFEQTLSLVHSADIAFVHVFRYSDRPGTRAASLPEKIPDGIKDERYDRLVGLGEKNRKRFLAGQTGRELRFVTERDGLLSSNYISLPYPSAFTLPPPGRLVLGRWLGERNVILTRTDTIQDSGIHGGLPQ